MRLINMEDFEKWRKESEKIPVPDSLKPEQIEQMLSHKKKEFRAKRTRRRTNLIAAAAACFLLVLAVGNTFFQTKSSPNEKLIVSDCQIPPSMAGDGIIEAKAEHTNYTTLYETISDCLDVDKEMVSSDSAMYEDRVYEENTASENDMASSGSPAKTKSAGSGSSDYTKTNLQVEGVDEGDLVKTDGSYIYHCSTNDSIYGSTVKIYQADGANTKQVAKIKLDSYDIQELYLADNRLIAIGTSWEEQEDSSSGKSKKDREYYPYSQQTSIFTYDVSDAANPTLLSQKKQSGTYHTSRKNGNYLYTLSTMYVYSATDINTKKDYIPSINGCVIPEDRLYLPEQVSSNCYLVLTALDVTKNEDFTDKLSVLGGGNICYVSENHIFVATPSSGDYSRTTISKYRYDNGRLEALAVRTFKGQLHNQFSMDEYNGYLRFVATTYQTNGSSTNGLYVLNKNLEPVGSVDKLAKNERIYSARFLGNRAYFVTYRETDPVFVVDLTEPENPVVKDKLKIPGFSEYLHPFGDNLLLGIGSNETKKGDMQVKLSMFDISDDTAIKEVHKKLTEADTTSIVGRNHKAVLVDLERNRIGLCIEAYNEKTTDYDSSYRIYSYGKKGFRQIAKLQPKNLTLDARGLYIGDYFYLVDNKVSVYDTETWQEILPH